MKKILALVLFSSLFASNANALFTDDPFLNKQWYLDSANVYNAWDVSSGSPDVIVAVIDSGVDTNHIDLKDNIWVNSKEIPNNFIDDDKNGYIDDINGYNFIDDNNDVFPKIDIGCISEKRCSLEGVNHGTVIAGVIAGIADNREGIAGIAHQVKIMPLKVLGPSGSGDVEDVVDAINYATSNGATVINMSFVGDSDSFILKKTIKEAADKGVIFVVASGNSIENGGIDLDKKPMYPVCSDFGSTDYIIGVSALDKNDNKAIFANYGSNCVDLSAPGVSIFSTTVYKPQHSSFNNYYNGYWSGTSVATPIVSSAIAIMKSINPALTSKNILDILIATGSNLKDPGMGKKIDVFKAVSYVKNQFGSDSLYFNLVTGSGYGDSPLVKVFRNNGYEESSFLAYDKNFKGGVNVSYGYLYDDFEKNIITTPASSGGPHLKVFDKNGNLKNQFFVFDKNYRGGVGAAVLNSNIPFEDPVLVASQTTKGSSSIVNILNKNGNILKTINPYDKNFKGGVNISSCKFDDYSDYFVTTPVSSGGPHLKVFDKNGNLKKQFFVFDKNYRGSVSVSCFDYNLDGIDEILTSISYGGNSYIRIVNKDGDFIKQFSINDKNFQNSINVSGFYSNDFNSPKILISPKTKGDPSVLIVDSNGSVFGKFIAYKNSLKNGMSLSVSK